MHGGAIVPHQDVAGSPRMAVCGFRPGRGGYEFANQRLPRMIAHAFDGEGVRSQIDGAPVVGRIALGHAPAHRGQFVALRRRHEFRIDLVTRGGVAVAHDEIP
jgi:hypothetical protein